MRRTLWVAGHETVRLAHAAATVDLHRVQYRKLALRSPRPVSPTPTPGSPTAGQP